MRTVLERFRSLYDIDPSGCWLWHGNTSHNGYGKFKVNSIQLRAHRFSYDTFVGPIPAGLHVLHTCDTRNCVNPAHLTAGSNADNIKDRWDKAVAAGATPPHRVFGPINLRGRPPSLSFDKANQARAASLAGASTPSIARRFNVSAPTVRAALNRTGAYS